MVIAYTRNEVQWLAVSKYRWVYGSLPTSGHRVAIVGLMCPAKHGRPLADWSWATYAHAHLCKARCECMHTAMRAAVAVPALARHGGAYTYVVRCSTIGAQGAWPLWQSHRRPPLVFLNTRLIAADAMVLRYMLQRNPAVGFIARAGNLRVDDRVNIAKLLVFAKRPRGLLVRHSCPPHE